RAEAAAGCAGCCATADRASAEAQASNAIARVILVMGPSQSRWRLGSVAGGVKLRRLAWGNELCLHRRRRGGGGGGERRGGGRGRWIDAKRRDGGGGRRGSTWGSPPPSRDFVAIHLPQSLRDRWRQESGGKKAEGRPFRTAPPFVSVFSLLSGGALGEGLRQF